eukprot:755376-Hanusia_phi.AAC.1
MMSKSNRRIGEEGEVGGLGVRRTGRNRIGGLVKKGKRGGWGRGGQAGRRGRERKEEEGEGRDHLHVFGL